MCKRNEVLAQVGKEMTEQKISKKMMKRIQQLIPFCTALNVFVETGKYQILTMDMLRKFAFNAEIPMDIYNKYIIANSNDKEHYMFKIQTMEHTTKVRIVPYEYFNVDNNGPKNELFSVIAAKNIAELEEAEGEL